MEMGYIWKAIQIKRRRNASNAGHSCYWLDRKKEQQAKMSLRASEWQSDEDFKQWLVFMGYAYLNARGQLRLHLAVYKQTKSLVISYMHQAYKAGVEFGGQGPKKKR